MSDFTCAGMSDLIYDILSGIKDDGYNDTECVLSNPTTKSKFPCRVIRTPLESVRDSINAVPIFKDFQVSVEHWSNSQRDSMAMSVLTDEQMRTKNFICTNTGTGWFDETTKKYIIRKTYEVRYNAITNAFEFIR